MGEGDFIILDDIPISTIELPEGRFLTFPDISLPEKHDNQFKVNFVRQFLSSQVITKLRSLKFPAIKTPFVLLI